MFVERAEFEMQGCPLQTCLVLKRNVDSKGCTGCCWIAVFLCLCVLGTFWALFLGVGLDGMGGDGRRRRLALSHAREANTLYRDGGWGVS